VSDATFWDVIAVTTRPVIASHSACRALARHPRNLSDAQLRALARTGGVVGINFYPVFLDDRFRREYERLRARLKPETDAIHARYQDRPGESAFAVDRLVGERVAAELAVPGIERLVAHIDHAVQVMGVDHVGLGSDFDGISVLPAPMKDVTSLPLVVAALRARGYSDDDVRKILGEDLHQCKPAARDRLDPLLGREGEYPAHDAAHIAEGERADEVRVGDRHVGQHRAHEEGLLEARVEGRALARDQPMAADDGVVRE